MPPYRLSGLTFQSDELSLDEHAHRVEASSAEFVLRVHRERPPTYAVDHTIEVDGHRVLVFGHVEAGSHVDGRSAAWVVRADELATFVIDRQVREVVCYPDRGTEADALRQLFVDRIVPHVADALGRTAIHASAVGFASTRTAAFLGDPGAGKSTLSAALCPPCTYVADDCAVLAVSDEGVVVHPSYSYARLHGDAAMQLEATDDIHVIETRIHKYRARRPAAAAPQPLTALYVLQGGDDIEIRPLGTRDAVVELARHLYRVGPTERQRLHSELDRLELLSRHVPVRALRYPRRFDVFDDVREAVAQDLERIANARSSSLNAP